VFERPEALANLLTAIDREVDPHQSTRVARALRRVVARDLDQRVTGALLQADQDMYNATRESAGSDGCIAPGQLVVLADSLAALRPDGRSRCLAGCARIVAKRFESASNLLGDERALGHGALLQGWLSLNLGAAQEGLRRFDEAHAAYTACGKDREHPSSAPAAVFAYFVSLRAGVDARAERDLRSIFDRDASAPGAILWA
jgi:hypothetical protein